ncbi:MbcA/ParS/Xre antitoxin family protein [Methylophilus sp. 5]|uniref:MbcA/ParS/Xre antitoxin family protein n=1 Tax=Methylophilus sp. 5 TaxID=1112274 RepID=UPI00048E72CE|nr:MbcA/ParS/Xre antitoxin family protein [Methylophilus sp. 5]
MKHNLPTNKSNTEIYTLAQEVFGSSVEADAWLNEVHALLGGISPIDYMKTENGKLEVQKILTAILYGHTA